MAQHPITGTLAPVRFDQIVDEVGIEKFGYGSNRLLSASH